MIYKCTATTFDPKKVYLGLTEGEFKKESYYYHVKSFRNKFYANSTTLSSYIWEIKNRKYVTPAHGKSYELQNRKKDVSYASTRN